jgi:hypothetical protein
MLHPHMKIHSLTLALLFFLLLKVGRRPSWSTTGIPSSGHHPGNRELPLKTVSAAAKKAQAGDEVLVRPGIYRESVSIVSSGAPGKPILFRSEVPRAAIPLGSDPVTEWRADSPACGR